MPQGSNQTHLILNQRYFHLFLTHLTLLLFSSFAFSQSPHSGYLSDVQLEKDQSFYEIFLFTAQPAKTRPLSELIFNERLSKEFKEKYLENFGQLDTETIIYQPTKFSMFDENRGAVLSIETKNDQRRQFGEYMIRRLIEWHVDNYFKTEPSMRAVYELKERLSHVEVAITKETRVNGQYSFSDNSLDIIIDGPHFETSKLTLQMDPKAFGPGQVLEEKLYLEKNLSKKLKLVSATTIQDGIAKLDLIRGLRNNWSTNFSTATAYKAGGSSSRETKYVIGLGHSY